MPQQEVEVILTRQLASYLAMPIFLVDVEGNLIYYNPPAERVFGLSFEDTGEMAPGEWGRIFNATDHDGSPVAMEDLPLVAALRLRRPASRRFLIRGLDNTERCVDMIAFPLVGQLERELGAMAVFAEVTEP